MRIRMGLGVVVAAVGLAALGACSRDIVWTRSGATPEDIARDQQDCTRDAPVNVYGLSSAVTVYMLPKVDPDCMIGKGYFVDIERSP